MQYYNPTVVDLSPRTRNNVGFFNTALGQGIGNTLFPLAGEIIKEAIKGPDPQEAFYEQQIQQAKDLEARKIRAGQMQGTINNDAANRYFEAQGYTADDARIQPTLEEELRGQTLKSGATAMGYDPVNHAWQKGMDPGLIAMSPQVAPQQDAATFSSNQSVMSAYPGD